MRAASALCLALLVGSAGGAAESSGVRGVWTAERSRWRVEKAGTTTLVELSLRRAGGRGHGNWNSSQPVPLAELAGLTAALMDAPSAQVRFDWRRDAGSFAFEGRFESGAGAGHFTFAPSAAYAADMRGRGYGEIDDEKALGLAIHDVSRSFISELAALGYERVPLDKLMALRIHGASAEFIRGLAGLGYKGLPLDQLVALRIHGASLDFVRDVHGLGFAGLPADKLVAFRIHGVSPEFIRALRGLGYDRLTVDQLVAMRIHGVSADFIRRVQQRSGKAVTVERLVSMRIHGEDPE